MDALRQHEYVALRATIRERGTVRAITFLVTILGWAFLHCGAPSFSESPQPFIVVPALVLLIAGFETVFQIHLGVERVGRYLQVAYEEAVGSASTESPAANADAFRGWETAAMAYGKTYRAVGSDALFSAVFTIAALLNLGPVLFLWRGWPFWFALFVLAHLAFVVRIRIAKRQAGGQRAEDLARFRELLGPPRGPS